MVFHFKDSSVGDIFRYMNNLLSDTVVETLSSAERREILAMIAGRFEMSEVKVCRSDTSEFEEFAYLSIYKCSVCIFFVSFLGKIINNSTNLMCLNVGRGRRQHLADIPEPRKKDSFLRPGVTVGLPKRRKKCVCKGSNVLSTKASCGFNSNIEYNSCLYLFITIR